MRLDTSLLEGISAAKTATKSSSHASQKASGTSSFTSALKAATSSDTTSSGTTSTKATSDVAETTQAVAGHPYAEILTGPRAGMYLNTSHNSRSGQPFVMVHRNGVELHVYGTGKNRHVVEMKRHTPLDTPTSTATTGTSSTSTAAPATGTTTSTGTTTTGTTSSGTVTSGKITTDASTL
jgi:hypothetical protein